jgi:hypothetical protein
MNFWQFAKRFKNGIDAKIEEDVRLDYRGIQEIEGRMPPFSSSAIAGFDYWTRFWDSLRV